MLTENAPIDHLGYPEPPEAAANAVRAALTRLDKQHGVGTAMLGSDRKRLQIETYSTGSLGLDRALGIGGYPKGRVTEIFGPESSGKTTLTLHAIASCQARGGIAAFIDAEHAFESSYATALGVDMDRLIISQPDHGEQALDVMEELVACGGVDLVVLDSVAALVPRAELEGEMSDTQVGLQARLMSKALRKVTGAANKSNTAVVFINQLRQKIGVMFGPSEVTAGGNALKYYASVRLDIRRVGSLKQGTEAVGNKTRVRVVKNKLAPPFRQAEFEILYGQGISRAGEALDVGLEAGFITRSGSWFAFEGETIGQGRESARAWLEEHPAKLADLVALLSLPADPATADTPAA